MALSVVAVFLLEVWFEMALSLQNLTKIRDEKKHAVYGYIREQYQGEVPHGVILICILFYACAWDEWDRDHIVESIILDEETGIVTQDRATKTSIFLKETVQSGIHSWKFKVIKCNNHECTTMHLGIWNIDSNHGKPPKSDTFYCGKASGYVFVSSTGHKKAGNRSKEEYGEQCKDGTIIEMIVDFHKLSLSFMVNGTDYGKAYDIEPARYRAAVYLFVKGDSYQFLEKY